MCNLFQCFSVGDWREAASLLTLSKLSTACLGSSPLAQQPFNCISFHIRFAEQAIFFFFCMFAVMLFSRDPKFIPGWASFFAPG